MYFHPANPYVHVKAGKSTVDYVYWDSGILRSFTESCDSIFHFRHTAFPLGDERPYEMIACVDASKCPVYHLLASTILPCSVDEVYEHFQKTTEEPTTTVELHSPECKTPQACVATSVCAPSTSLAMKTSVKGLSKEPRLKKSQKLHVEIESIVHECLRKCLTNVLHHLPQ